MLFPQSFGPIAALEKQLALRAESAMAAADWTEALNRWRFAERVLGSSTPPSVYLRGSMAASALEHWKLAEGWIEAGVRLHPQDPLLALESAEIALRQGSWEEAETRWLELRQRGSCGSERIRIGQETARKLRERHAGPVSGLELNTQKVETLNGRAAGRTLFIFGAGPSLNTLDSSEISALKNELTIGVNRTQFKVPPSYFLSAYPAEVLLAARSSPLSQIIHMRPVYAEPLDPRFMSLQRERWRPGRPLPTRLAGPQPCILTSQNVLFGALNLGAIMEPKRIALLGFEQRNPIHFYHYDAELQARLAEEYLSLHASHGAWFDLDHGGARNSTTDIQTIVEGFFEQPEKLAVQPFHPNLNHLESLKAYFEQLTDRGIEIVSCAEDGICTDAGAAYLPISRVLGQG